MTDTLKQEIARALRATKAERDNGFLHWELEELTTAALSVVQPRIERLEEAAEFLCARLRDLEGYDGDELLRQLMGHVLPALARMEAALTHKETEA